MPGSRQKSAGISRETAPETVDVQVRYICNGFSCASVRLSTKHVGVSDDSTDESDVAGESIELERYPAARLREKVIWRILKLGGSHGRGNNNTLSDIVLVRSNGIVRQLRSFLLTQQQVRLV